MDRSDLLDRLLAAEGSDSGAWEDRALGRADEVRRPEPASAASGARLPRSRDFQ
jgi:error-prone DNA polymerase